MKIFSEAVVQTIKEHIDTGQGPGSLYLRDLKEALHTLKARIEQQHPHERPFTTSQLHNKIMKIALREGNIKAQLLFERGTSSLRKPRLEFEEASITVLYAESFESGPILAQMERSR